MPSTAMMALWHNCVFYVFGGQCVVCGKTTGIEAHHIERRPLLLRHDWRNGVPACGGTEYCHRFLATAKGKVYLRAILGDEWMDDLRDRAHKDGKQYLQELGMSREEYTAMQREELKKRMADPAQIRIEYGRVLN